MPDAGSTPEQEQRLNELFQAHERDVRIANYRTCGLFAMLFMMAGCSLDWVVYGMKGVLDFLPLRIGSVAVLASVNVLLRTDWGARTHRLLGLLMGMPLVVVIAIMIALTEGADSPYYAGLNLVLLGAAVLMRWPLGDSILVVLLTISAYLIACRFHGPITNTRIFFNNLYFLSVTGVFTVVGTWIYNRIRFSEFRTRHALDLSRRQLEAANTRLEENNRQLLELDESKSRFFANISHELRTPLTLLIAPLDVLLSRTQEHSADHEILSTMRTNAMRLLKLINDLLELVKLESGRIQVNLMPLNVADFIREQAAAVRPMAEERGVNLLTVTDSAPSSVHLDEEKMERICLNLLFNAIKFTPSGGRVELSARSEGKWLEIRVKDTGKGIAPDQLKHVFDRFWQADSTASRKPRGLGIGLALVKELAEAQGGMVSAASEPGKGTTMLVRLPLAAVPEPVERPSSQEPVHADSGHQHWLAELYKKADLFPVQLQHEPGAASAVHRTQDGELPLLLIAEDEPEMVRFLAAQLAAHFRVLEAKDGAEAIRLATEHQPDVILSDMMMPEKDGFEVCSELHSRPDTRDIPIVMLTAKADEETKLSLLHAGAADFLAKPFSLIEIVARLRNLAAMRLHAKHLVQQREQIAENLAQLKEAESLLVRNEKLASLGRLSAGLIHEINNPLNYAKQALYVIRRQIKPMEEAQRNEILEVINDVEGGIDRVTGITSELRGFATRSTERSQHFPVLPAVEATLRFFAPVANGQVPVKIDIPEDLEMQADRNQFLQVLINLIQNALDAVASKEYPSGEAPTIAIQAKKAPGVLLLRIRDNGPGISPDVMNQIFDPFFTTKDVGQGMGLGLSISHRIMTEHHGRITVDSEPGCHTEFILEFPEEIPTQSPPL